MFYEIRIHTYQKNKYCKEGYTHWSCIWGVAIFKHFAIKLSNKILLSHYKTRMHNYFTWKNLFSHHEYIEYPNNHSSLDYDYAISIKKISFKTFLERR